jgi:TRAP-type C4-dicarboxylate transport system permease small subunit
VIDKLLVWSDGLGRVVAALSAVMIAGIGALILAEITLRSTVNISLPYAWEYSAYLHGMAVFCGAAFTLRQAGHVRVQLLTTSTRTRRGLALELFATVLGLLTAAVVAWGLTALAIDSGLKGRTSSTINAVPLVYPQGAIAFGAVLLVLQIALRLVRLLLGRPPDVISKEYTVE